jgi:pyrophosphate--fructose-6-phosphate 1-phosphotransferase
MKVAMLTAGGLAPCLSAAVGSLIKRYTEIDPGVELMAYRDGYAGLLCNRRVTITREVRERAMHLTVMGGSPIGNSRVKLTNVNDCLRRRLIAPDENPLEVAARRLAEDEITVLHTVGGDDTSLMAAELSAHLREKNYPLQVIGLPKTIDNDIFPIRQSLGALTAAEQGALFFENVVSEYSASPRMLIVHEVMGRHCGWLAFATALAYTRRIDRYVFVPELGVTRRQRDIHGLYVPELPVNFHAEAQRLKKVLDTTGCLNIFVSEGAFTDDIVRERELGGREVQRDAFGHVKIDTMNTGQWVGAHLKDLVEAEKILVQKSGYFARSAPANEEDLALIHSCVEFAVECAFKGQSGVVGHDEEHQNRLRCIEFDRIRGGKPFDVRQAEFRALLETIGQNI